MAASDNLPVAYASNIRRMIGATFGSGSIVRYRLDLPR